jgi:hypothetical protein
VFQSAGASAYRRAVQLGALQLGAGGIAVGRRQLGGRQRTPLPLLLENAVVPSSSCPRSRDMSLTLPAAAGAAQPSPE